MKFSKISWSAEALRVPFTGTKGPVDCGIFGSEEISRLDLLHRSCPVTTPESDPFFH
uniref:Uncharacterized protein n=1 Tax=Pygocentrus nattereri TaxID=42514 RepID=A0AAR2LG78_PYGNA